MLLAKMNFEPHGGVFNRVALKSKTPIQPASGHNITETRSLDERHVMLKARMGKSEVRAVLVQFNGFPTLRAFHSTREKLFLSESLLS